MMQLSAWQMQLWSIYYNCIIIIGFDAFEMRRDYEKNQLQNRIWKSAFSGYVSRVSHWFLSVFYCLFLVFIGMKSDETLCNLERTCWLKSETWCGFVPLCEYWRNAQTALQVPSLAPRTSVRKNTRFFIKGLGKDLSMFFSRELH